MSADAHAHHGPGSPDHVPHVTPLPVYLKTFGALVILTFVTVGVSYIDLGTTVNLIIAVAIATIKATTVAAFFMHLASDHKFHSVVFGSSLVFLAIFISFTMFDTTARGMFDTDKKNRPANMHDPFAVPTVSASAPAAPSAAPPAPPAKP